MSIEIVGKAATRLGLRQIGPLLVGAHHRDDAARRVGGGFESLAFPAHQRRLDFVAFGIAFQDFADGGAVMRKVGMQPHEPSIAGVVHPGDHVPSRWRWLALDPQVALAAALDDGMTHVDGDLLRLAAAQFPQFSCGQSSRSNSRLRRRCHSKGRRQLRFLSRQSEVVERTKVAAHRTPEIGQNFARRLHERIL